MDLKRFIRDVPDFPKKGILFKDITPLLGDAAAFAETAELIAAHYKGRGIKRVAGIESRGFLFAASVALKLGAGVLPVRKKGKLPYKTISLSYDLEYGTDTVEIHEDAVAKGEKVLLIDDLIATGGTAAAAADLIERAGGEIAGVCFVIELSFLNGRSKLKGREIHSLLTY